MKNQKKDQMSELLSKFNVEAVDQSCYLQMSSQMSFSKYFELSDETKCQYLSLMIDNILKYEEKNAECSTILYSSLLPNKYIEDLWQVYEQASRLSQKNGQQAEQKLILLETQAVELRKKLAQNENRTSKIKNLHSRQFLELSYQKSIFLSSLIAVTHELELCIKLKNEKEALKKKSKFLRVFLKNKNTRNAFFNVNRIINEAIVSPRHSLEKQQNSKNSAQKNLKQTKSQQRFIPLRPPNSKSSRKPKIDYAARFDDYGLRQHQYQPKAQGSRPGSDEHKRCIQRKKSPMSPVLGSSTKWR